MRFLSVCSGIEAASIAWMPLGWRPVAFSEIDPFPCELLRQRHPGVPNRGDMTRFQEWPDEPIDLLAGGTPCFAGHTLIANKRGLVPISQVSVGDEVLTHRGRWRRVLATGHKLATTTFIHGQGHSDGIETTDDHPFYARQKKRVWLGRDAGSWRSVMGEPDWKAAKDMVGRFWASPTVWPESEVPAIDAIGRERDAPDVTAALMRVAGRWLGDGWCRINDRRGYVLICCAKHERETVERELLDAGLRFSVSDERTTFRFQIASRALARWLIDNFNSGARNKTVPTWLLGLPEDLRESFFQGYLAADGCKTTNGHRASTVSRGIALGLTLLAHTLGLSVSRRFVLVNRKTATIENREVREHGFYQLTFYHRSRSSVADGLHRWGLVRKLSRGRETTVFNLEVEEDNSYVADGIVVHNCQSFSVAGLRKGLDDPRGDLMLTFGAIAAKYRPRWLVWENVPGVLSSNGGRDFGAFLGLLAELGYGFAYRVLDAQYVRVESHPGAVPQRRRRVFVVGHSGGLWQRAAAVLFERESMRGHPAPRRETGKSVAGTVGTSSSGGCLTRRMDKGFNSPLDEGQTPVLVFDPTQIASPGNYSSPRPGDPAHPLAHGARPPVIAFPARLSGTQCASSTDVSPALGSANPMAVSAPMCVRRLTPLEAERLMGFPDGYTAIQIKGKPAADGPRYRALGNSWAVNVARWVGERIAAVEAIA